MNQLFGVLLGGVLALIGSFAAKFWDQWREAVALRGAFRAEIAGLLEIAEVRKHEAVVEWIIGQWKAGNEVPANFFGLEKSSRDPIFTANAGSIGSIGRELAAEVTAFYTQLQAVRIVIQAFDEGKMLPLPLPQRIAHAEATLEIWRMAKAKGAALVAKL